MASPPEDENLKSSIPDRTEDALLTLLTALLVVLAVSQIVLRNLFTVTLMWAEPVVRMLVLWTAFLGALIAARENRHIRIDAVLRLLPDEKRPYVDLLVNLFNAVACGSLAAIAADFVHDEHAYGMRGALELPTWIFQLIFPLAFGVMCWRYLRRCLSSLRSILHKP